MGRKTDRLNDLVSSKFDCNAWNRVNELIGKAFEDPYFSLDELVKEEEKRQEAPLARILYEEGGRDGGRVIVEIKGADEDKFKFESSYKVFMTDFPDGNKYPLVPYNLIRKIARLRELGYKLVFQYSVLQGPFGGSIAEL